MITRFRGEHSFLLNMYSVPGGLEFSGLSFDSVEVAYQWAICGSEEGREKILAENNGVAAKRLGKKYPRKEDYQLTNLELMETLLREKFRVPGLSRKLLLTSGEELVEGNTYGDAFWGVSGGRGENHLGRMLMIIRRENLSVAQGLKVHTDYWGRRTSPWYPRVGICRNMLGMKAENVLGLAPSDKLRRKYRWNKDWGYYTALYWDEIDQWMLSKPGVAGYSRVGRLWSVMRIISVKVAANREFALTCFEKPGDNCHRHLLYEGLDPGIRGENN